MAKLINMRKFYCVYCKFDTIHFLISDISSECLRCEKIHSYKIDETINFSKNKKEEFSLENKFGEMPL